MVGGTPSTARWAGYIIVSVATIFMLAPLVVIVGASLSAGGYLVFPPQGLSLKWFAEVLDSPGYLHAGFLSLRIALVVTAISVSIGTAAAIALTRFRFSGRDVLQGVFLSPLIMPTILFGIGMLVMFSHIAGGPSVSAIIVGHVVITLPYVVRTASAVLVGVDPAAEEAARVMGAKTWQRYTQVLLPQCWPGIAAGAFFAFNISFDDAVIALFLRGPETETLPIKIYTEVEFTTDPSVAAVSTIMIAITVVLVLAIERTIGLGLMLNRQEARPG